MSMHPTRNLFKEFKNRFFVETGSWRGDGIQLALDADFEQITSIDIDPSCLEFCRSRFDLVYFPEQGIELVCGDSAICLESVIQKINEPATFWLDSHWQMFEGTDPGANPFPLLKELEQIARHPIKTHTILIDDLLIMQDDIVGYSRRDIQDALHRINPAYHFKYFANPVINSILVAHV